MKALNELIRKEIDKNAKLRAVNKDAPKKTAFENAEKIKARDKKIAFFEKLSSTIREMDNNEQK